MTLPGQDAINRFLDNEPMLDQFINGTTPYTTSGGLSVPTLPSLSASIVNFGANNGASFLGYLAPFTNAVFQTQYQKNQDIISVKGWGAVGDGVADDTAAFNNALTDLINLGGGKLIVPPGTYKITSWIGNHTSYGGKVNIEIEGQGHPILNVVFASAAVFLLNLTLTWLDTLIIRNLDMQCNSLVAYGIYVHDNAGSNATRNILIEDVTINNILQDTTGRPTGGCAGIFVSSNLSTAAGGTVVLNRCNVNHVTRNLTAVQEYSGSVSTGNGTSTGISVNGYSQVNLNNCWIDTILTGSNGIADADAVKVFSWINPNGAGAGVPAYAKTDVLINNTVLRNYCGRAVKLQTHGMALVNGCLITMDAAIVMIDGHRCLDSQVYDVNFINNKIYYGVSPTKVSGSTVCCFNVQVSLPNGGVVGSGNGALELPWDSPCIRISHNDVFSAHIQDTTHGFDRLIVFGDLNSTNPSATTPPGFNQLLKIDDNRLMLNQDPFNAAGTQYAAGFFLYWPVVTAASISGRILIEITNNFCWTNEWIYISAGGSVDYTGKLFIRVEGNTRPILQGAGHEVFYNGATNGYTNNLVVRNNRISTSGSYISWPLDLAQLPDGNDFTIYSTPPTITHGPAVASMANATVRREGAVFTVTIPTSGRTYISSAPGTSWALSSWVPSKGTTTNRPTPIAADLGLQYLDTTLATNGKLITWNGAAWVDPTGTIV